MEFGSEPLFSVICNYKYLQLNNIYYKSEIVKITNLLPSKVVKNIVNLNCHDAGCEYMHAEDITNNLYLL